MSLLLALLLAPSAAFSAEHALLPPGFTGHMAIYFDTYMPGAPEWAALSQSRRPERLDLANPVSCARAFMLLHARGMSAERYAALSAEERAAALGDADAAFRNQLRHAAVLARFSAVEAEVRGSLADLEQGLTVLRPMLDKLAFVEAKKAHNEGRARLAHGLVASAAATAEALAPAPAAPAPVAPTPAVAAAPSRSPQRPSAPPRHAVRSFRQLKPGFIMEAERFFESDRPDVEDWVSLSWSDSSQRFDLAQPVDRMRAYIVHSMGWSADSYAAMPPATRANLLRDVQILFSRAIERDISKGRLGDPTALDDLQSAQQNLLPLLDPLTRARVQEAVRQGLYQLHYKYGTAQPRPSRQRLDLTGQVLLILAAIVIVFVLVILFRAP